MAIGSSRPSEPRRRRPALFDLRYDRQLVLALLVAALVPLALFALVAFPRVSAAVRAEGERGAADAVRSARALVDQRGTRLAAVAASYATWATFIDYVAQMQTDRLQTDVAAFLVDKGTADAVAVVIGPTDAAMAGGDAATLASIARAALASAPPGEEEIGPGIAALASGIHVVSVRPLDLGGREGPGATAASDGGAAIAVSRRLDGGFAIDAATLTGFAVSVYLDDGRLSVTSDADAAAAAGPPAPAPKEAGQVVVRDTGGYATGATGLVDRSGEPVGTLEASGRLDVLNAIDADLTPILGFGFALSAIGAVIIAILLSLRLRRRLGAIAGGMTAVAGGDTSVRLPDTGGDEVARLAASHNRLAATLERRDRALHASVGEVATLTPDRAIDDLAAAGTRAAIVVFGFASACLLDEDGRVMAESPEATPGDRADPVDMPERDGGDDGTPRAEAGVTDAIAGSDVAAAVPVPPGTWRLHARLAPGQEWSDADGALLSLYGRQLGAAIRDAQLYADAAHRAAELERVNRLQGDFLRGVSHNLQTPLTHITVVAGELRETHPGDRSVTRDADVIRTEGERLSRLVSQLLTLSRLEAGAVAVTAEPVSIATIVARVAPAAGDRPVAFVDDAPGLVPIADPAAVEQVLWMLLDNAARYAPEGQVRVHVARASCEALGETGRADAEAAVEVAVEDEGPGVPLDERERIFERFARGSTAGDHAGTGLGLDVARGLVTAMGGRIRCERAPGGGGGRFAFTLPAEEAAGPA